MCLQLTYPTNILLFTNANYILQQEWSLTVPKEHYAYLGLWDFVHASHHAWQKESIFSTLLFYKILHVVKSFQKISYHFSLHFLTCLVSSHIFSISLGLVIFSELRCFIVSVSLQNSRLLNIEMNFASCSPCHLFSVIYNSNSITFLVLGPFYIY